MDGDLRPQMLYIAVESALAVKGEHMRLVSALVLVLTSLAVSAADKTKGTGECSQFVPEGKHYTYTIVGTVDRSTKGATVKETMNVSGDMTFTVPRDHKETKEDNEKAAAAFAKESEPFQKCLEAVLAGK